MQQLVEKPLAGRFLLGAAALVVVVAGLRAAQIIIVPFLLAVFVAVLLTPVLSWLTRRGVPTIVALLLVGLLVLVVAGGVAYVVGTSLNEFTRNIPKYQTRLQQESDRFYEWLSARGFDVREDPELAIFTPRSVMQFVRLIVGELGGISRNAFLVLITVIFMLLEAARFPEKVHAAFGGSTAAWERVEAILLNIRRYLWIKTFTSLLTGILVCLLTWLLGIDYPLLWGLLAFLLNYVPYIGSIIAAVPAVLLALVDGDLSAALWTAVGYLAINNIVSLVIEPPLMGQGLGLSTLVVLLSLIFWGWILGPVGMLLSAPLTMAVKIVLNEFEDTQWIAVLLGPKAPADAPH